MRRLSVKFALFGVLILCALFLLPAGVEAAEIETVRVGFFRMDGYHEVDENGQRDGYGYALMQNIRRYSNLNFKYVGYEKTWAEMLQMLETGEIDVLSYAAYTPERSEKFLYSSIPVGTCDLVISVKAGNTSVVQGDYSTYDGLRVGLVEGTAENEVFVEFAAEKGFSYEEVWYDGVAQLSDALQRGEVDCIVYTDFRSESDEWIVERLTASDLYLIVRKEDTQLMAQLNAALERLDTRETGWRSVLKNTYYPYGGTSTIYFTVDEQNALARYAQGGAVLRVTAIPDNAPYSWYDTDENGNRVVRGIQNTLFSELMGMLGVRYEYVVPADYDEYMQLIRRGEVDIVVDMPQDMFAADRWGYITTPEYDSLALARVYNREFDGTAEAVAYLKSTPYLAERVKELSGDARILVYDSAQEAIEALNNGEIDLFYCLEHTAKVLINQDERAQLRHAVLSGEEYLFRIAVREDIDRGLVSAFSTVIEHSGGKILQGIYDDNINFGVDRTPNLLAAFYHDPVPVVSAGAIIVLVIVFLLFIVLHIRRRERERILRADVERNALLSTIYSAMSFGLLRLEITEGDFRVIYANPHFLEMIGAQTLDEANERYIGGMGRGILDKDREDVRAMYDDLRCLGDSTVAESRAKAHDGSIHWVRCTSTLVDIVGKTRVVQQLILDITEERQTQERQEREHTDQALNEMFAILTRRALDIYILYSLDNHQTRFISPNTELLLGIPVESVRADIHVLLEAQMENKYVLTEESLKKIECGENIIGETKRVNLKSGEDRWYQDEAYIFRIGGERHLIIVMSDRTEERRTREALQTALGNAENANKAKTLFFSNMSHDIRTPMSTILGLSKLMKSDLDDREKAEAHLAQLEITANSMMEIINNVLDMSRIESGAETLNEAPFHLPDLLKEIDAITATQVHVKDMTVSAETDVEEEVYIGDALRLKQILLNLVSNAIKYTPRGGRIALKVRTFRHLSAQCSILRFTVSDNGIGMSESFQKELFAPFARERNTTTSGIIGTGLGMSIVKNLVELMGGTIRVKSEEGKGTTFIVDIPLRTEGSVEQQEVECTETEDVDISGVRLLVAEDNDLNAEILIELLSREGAQCDRAENGRVVVDKFVADPDAYDMILMDIQMPVMDGYAAARTIRASGCRRAETIPISAMTANAFTEDIEAARAAGMNDHIAKPVDMMQLKAMIRRLMADN